jgi:hypothetical protein
VEFLSMSGMIRISIMCVHLDFGIVSELCDEWINFQSIHLHCPALPAASQLATPCAVHLAICSRYTALI